MLCTIAGIAQSEEDDTNGLSNLQTHKTSSFHVYLSMQSKYSTHYTESTSSCACLKYSRSKNERRSQRIFSILFLHFGDIKKVLVNHFKALQHKGALTAFKVFQVRWDTCHLRKNCSRLQFEPLAE